MSQSPAGKSSSLISDAYEKFRAERRQFQSPNRAGPGRHRTEPHGTSIREPLEQYRDSALANVNNYDNRSFSPSSSLPRSATFSAFHQSNEGNEIAAARTNGDKVEPQMSRGNKELNASAGIKSQSLPRNALLPSASSPSLKHLRNGHHSPSPSPSRGRQSPWRDPALERDKQIAPILNVFDNLNDYLSDSDASLSLDYKINLQRKKRKADNGSSTSSSRSRKNIYGDKIKTGEQEIPGVQDTPEKNASSAEEERSKKNNNEIEIGDGKNRNSGKREEVGNMSRDNSSFLRAAEEEDQRRPGIIDGLQPRQMGEEKEREKIKSEAHKSGNIKAQQLQPLMTPPPRQDSKYKVRDLTNNSNNKNNNSIPDSPRPHAAATGSNSSSSSRCRRSPSFSSSAEPGLGLEPIPEEIRDKSGSSSSCYNNSLHDSLPRRSRRSCGGGGGVQRSNSQSAIDSSVIRVGSRVIQSPLKV